MESASTVSPDGSTTVPVTSCFISRRARRFANQLHGRFKLPVALVDERLTSFDADLRLREAGVRGRDRKGLDDAVAAQQILQDHFEQSHAREPSLA